MWPFSPSSSSYGPSTEPWANTQAAMHSLRRAVAPSVCCRATSCTRCNRVGQQGGRGGRGSRQVRGCASQALRRAAKSGGKIAARSGISPRAGVARVVAHAHVFSLSGSHVMSPWPPHASCKPGQEFAVLTGKCCGVLTCLRGNARVLSMLVKLRMHVVSCVHRQGQVRAAAAGRQPHLS